MLLLQLALEKESDQHLNAYRPGGGGSGSRAKGYQGARPGQGTTPKHRRITDNVKELFWCDFRDEHGHLQHAPDCEQRDCFVVQGKRQETNTGAKPKLPDHYRGTITCAFCGKSKHYEDECYHKQRLSAKLKGEDPGKGSGKGGGKSNGNDAGKGKSKGRGKGQDKSQGGRGGGANRQPDKDNKNPVRMMAASKTEGYQLRSEGAGLLQRRPEPGVVRQRQATCLGPLLQQGEKLQLQILLALFRDGLREPQVQ